MFVFIYPHPTTNMDSLPVISIAETLAYGLFSSGLCQGIAEVADNYGKLVGNSDITLMTSTINWAGVERLHPKTAPDNYCYLYRSCTAFLSVSIVSKPGMCLFLT